jgi:hypothetical protein
MLFRRGGRMNFEEAGWKPFLPRNAWVGWRAVDTVGQQLGIFEVVTRTKTGGAGACEMRAATDLYNQRYRGWVGNNSAIAGDAQITLDTTVFMQEASGQFRTEGRTFANSNVQYNYDRFQLISPDDTVMGTFTIFDNAIADRNPTPTTDYLGLSIRKYGEDDYMVTFIEFQPIPNTWIEKSITFTSTGYDRFKLRWDIRAKITGSAVAEPCGLMNTPETYWYNPVYKEAI